MTMPLGAGDARDRLRGVVPPELGRLDKLELLRPSNNALTDPIPPELAALDTLSVLRLNGNELTGCIAFGLHRVPNLTDCESPDGGVDNTETEGVVASMNAFVNTYDGPRIITSTHNMLLQVGLQTGVFGMTVLGFLFASLILNLRTGRKVTPLQCYVAVCTVFPILHSNVDTYFFQADLIRGIFAWILIGLGAPHRQAANRLPGAACPMSDLRVRTPPAGTATQRMLDTAAMPLADRSAAIETGVANPANRIGGQQ